ncbi:MAG: RES family NAD+ phosphorylase [Pararhodobacter sp.]|nr:RES family NAD+ phosphorylase [Pararhodobacter sp.]
MPLVDGRYKGRLYRALNPVYARTPLSGQGAALYGGRFNRKGDAALYTALDPATALREANQVGDLQPTTLVAYRADLGPVFDTRDVQALAAHGMTAAGLADAGWRADMLAGQPVPTQAFAQVLIKAGFAGLLVRSFAQGTTDANLNLVLWRWNYTASDRLDVIDDENRLGRL